MPYETVYNKQYANKYNKLWKMQEMVPMSLWYYLEQQVTTGHPIKDRDIYLVNQYTDKYMYAIHWRTQNRSVNSDECQMLSSLGGN